MSDPCLKCDKHNDIVLLKWHSLSRLLAPDVLIPLILALLFGVWTYVLVGWVS